MRFQVPQFVDIEDKIIGPLTLKQFLMYFSAAMTLVPVYLFSDLALFIAVALPILGITAAFAHLRINGKSLFETLINTLFFYTSSQLFIWKRTSKVSTIAIHDPHWEELIDARQSATDNFHSLAQRAQALETEGNVVQSEEVVDEIAPNES